MKPLNARKSVERLKMGIGKVRMYLPSLSVWIININPQELVDGMAY